MKAKLATRSKQIAAAGALCCLAIGAEPMPAQASPTAASSEKQTAATQSTFYCNTKALTPVERAHHKQLTDKLLALRKEAVEIEKGYEFQYSPSELSLAELADWAVAEAKCCSFFDFHLDLERQGTLLCLRLTGDQGIKPFIRSEFHVPTK